MFGADSRIVVELEEERLSVYYLFDVFNQRLVPVEPDTAIAFTLPFGAQAATILPESAASTRINGLTVTIDGPFRPGLTPLRVGYSLAFSGDAVAVAQPLPADLEGLLMVVRKWGAMDLVSDQIARRADMTPEGTDATYIFAAGPAIRAGHAAGIRADRPAAPQPDARLRHGRARAHGPRPRRLGRRDAGRGGRGGPAAPPGAAPREALRGAGDAGAATPER